MIPAEESRCHRTFGIAHHWIAVEVIGHPAAKHLEEAEILWCEHISQCASCHELLARTSPLHVLVDLDARIVGEHLADGHLWPNGKAIDKIDGHEAAHTFVDPHEVIATSEHASLDQQCLPV